MQYFAEFALKNTMFVEFAAKNMFCRTEDVSVRVPTFDSNVSTSTPHVQEGDADSISDATSLPMDPTKLAKIFLI